MIISQDELITDSSSNAQVRFAVRRLQDLWNSQEREKFTINQEELPPAPWSNTETPSEVPVGTMREIENSSLCEVFDGRGWQRFTKADYEAKYVQSLTFFTP